MGEPRLLTDADFEAVIMAAIEGGYGRKHAPDPDAEG
jgi:hypothetical protein